VCVCGHRQGHAVTGSGGLICVCICVCVCVKMGKD